MVIMLKVGYKEGRMFCFFSEGCKSCIVIELNRFLLIDRVVYVINR